MSPRWESNPSIRRGRTVVCTLHAHVVCTPEYRRGPFTDDILTRCGEITRAVCADFETELVEHQGMHREPETPRLSRCPKVAVTAPLGP
ncbi:transposase, partial [Streptosporangium canum]|uniref:transposase n=1 Tax=Streptosporangium canum TaxID=324952 RepID=UPI003441CAFE